MFKSFVPTKEYDLIHELGICGCGNPEIAYKEIHNMLKRSVDPERYDRDKHDKWLIPDYEYDGYILFMAYTLDHNGFLTHGSSIYGAVLTDKGKQLLKVLDEFEKYEYDWDNVNYDMPNMFYVEEGESNE